MRSADVHSGLFHRAQRHASSTYPLEKTHPNTLTMSRLFVLLALLRLSLPSFADEWPGEGTAETAARNMIAGIETKIKGKTKAEVTKMLGAPPDPGADNFFYDVPVFESDATRITKYNVLFLDGKVFAVKPNISETVIFATQLGQNLINYAGFVGQKPPRRPSWKLLSSVDLLPD